MTERERLEAEAVAKEAEADRVFQAKGRAGLAEAAALQDEAKKLRAQVAALPTVPGSATPAPVTSTPAVRPSVTNLLSGRPATTSSPRAPVPPATTGGTSAPAPVRTIGATGAVGPAGPSGPSGPVGPPGPAGPTGATPPAPPALPPSPTPAPIPAPAAPARCLDSSHFWMVVGAVLLSMTMGCAVHSFSQFQARQQLRYGVPVIQNTGGGQAATPQAPPTTTRPSLPRRRPDPVVEDVQKGLDEYFEKRTQEALNP